MSIRSEEDDYAVTSMVAKPLYIGLIVNVVIPMVFLLVCYWLDRNNRPDNIAGDFANSLFYTFATLALAQAGLALWWRRGLMLRPMVRSEDVFIEDITVELVRRLRPMFILIASISVYGYLYFFLTGRFREAALMVLFSFLVFQVVRPRVGSVRKLVAHQRELVENGQFLNR